MEAFLDLRIGGIPLVLFAGITGALLLLGLALLPSGGGGRALDKRLRQVTARADGLRQKDPTPTIMLRQRRAGETAGLGRLLNLMPRPDLLRTRLQRTGLAISIGRYMAAMAGVAFVVMAALWLFAGLNILLSLMVGIAAGLALPHFVISKLIARRSNRFTAQFPEAIDLIVRGLKSGLPATESMRTVATEIADPVGTEFAAITEGLQFGTTLEEALWQTADRIDTAEFRFFVVSISVQRETGGNLGETLENLSDVLRKRKQTKMKIRALSAEARASAAIIGALPFVMFGILWMVNKEFLMPLFTDIRGNFMVGAGLTWLGIGFMTMRKMVRFEI